MSDEMIYPMHPSHPDFWSTENIVARSKAAWIGDRPEREVRQENRRRSAIHQTVEYVRILAEDRREAIIAAFQREVPVGDQLTSHAGGDAGIGLLQGEDEFGKEHLRGAAPQLQFLDFLIDILRHAESPLVEVMAGNSAENAAAHRSNGGV